MGEGIGGYGLRGLEEDEAGEEKKEKKKRIWK